MTPTLLKVVGAIIALLAALFIIGWLGLRTDAKPFVLPGQTTRDLGAMALPQGLPDPVARYAEAAFGAEIPIVESGMVIGRADVNLNGIPMHTRFKFYYEAGASYYHFIEVTWFGRIAVLKVNERYRDGVAILDTPGGRVEDQPKVNAAANLGLWAEAIWLPSIFFTDARVQWEAVDESAARLVVPNAAEEEVFTVTFDPATGLLAEMSAWRYRSQDDEERTLWTNTVREWGEFNGVMVPVEAETRWAGEEPWAIWHVEQVVYNIDVSGRFAQFGGRYQD